MNTKFQTIFIAAGGTGGHIFPALAIAEVLQQQQIKIVWIGGANGLEHKIIPPTGYQFHSLKIGAWRKQSLSTKLIYPYKLIKVMIHAGILILKSQPSLIIGFGGYPTFSICLMGVIFRIPTIIHEQNSIAGLSNKILAKIVDLAISAYPQVFKQGLYLGNPVREKISIASSQMQNFKLDIEISKLKILIVGGSLGANIFNQQLPSILCGINNIAQVTHQAGNKADLVELKKLYQSLKPDLEVSVLAFITDMASAYLNHDLIICRAGASTIAEIMVFGIAAIFIPYPYAVDDHQTSNAQFLVNHHAGLLIPQKNEWPQNLSTLLNQLTIATCKKMALKVKQLGVTNAKELIVAQILKLMIIRK